MRACGQTQCTSRGTPLLTKVLLLLFVACIPVKAVSADLPPEEYERLRTAAPIVVEIQVEQVRRGFGFFRQSIPVTVTATLVAVVVGPEHLRTGDSVVITYTHQRPRRGWVGPRPIPLLQRGQPYTAYLRQGEDGSGTYHPAARGASFE